jgi:hypothetical protein
MASDERILGSSDFVSTVLKQANEQYQKNRLLAIIIETLIMFVCDHLHIDASLLLSPDQAEAGSTCSLPHSAHRFHYPEVGRGGDC